MIRASNLLPVCGCRVAKSCQVQDAGDVVRKAAVGVGASGVAKLQSTNGGEGRNRSFRPALGRWLRALTDFPLMTSHNPPMKGQTLWPVHLSVPASENRIEHDLHLGPFG